MKKAALDASQAQRIMDLNQYLGIMNANTLFIRILAESQSLSNTHSYAIAIHSLMIESHTWSPSLLVLTK